MPQLAVAQAWLEYIVACKTVSTTEDLTALTVTVYNKLGFEYVNISLLRDYDLPKEELKFGIASTYPLDWASYYAQRDCIRFDPVAFCARGDVEPFYWDDLQHLMVLTPLQISFLELAKEAGLYNGIGLPFVGSKSRQGGIALATARPDTEHVRDLELLWSISNLFHKRLRALILGPAWPAVKPLELTTRETDILALTGKGLTDRHIAVDLKLTENTVNTYFRRIFRKLGAHTRVEAFAMAVRQQIIDLL